MITTPEQFAQWEFEHRQVEALLRRIEQMERAALADMGCPTDVEALYAILSGEQTPPWPTDDPATSNGHAERVRLALHTLSYIRQARGHLALGGSENPRLAAYSSLMAGLLATRAAVEATIDVGRQQREAAVEAALDTERQQRQVERREQSRSGGLVTGKATSEKAAKHDHEIRRLYSRWLISDELQDQSSQVAYIAQQTDLRDYTVRRRLAALRLIPDDQS
jgi:hypothetical protein